MVWHNYIAVHDNSSTETTGAEPLFFNHLAGHGEAYLAVDDRSKQVLLPPSADRHEISSRTAVVVRWQSGASPSCAFYHRNTIWGLRLLIRILISHLLSCRRTTVRPYRRARCLVGAPRCALPPTNHLI